MTHCHNCGHTGTFVLLVQCTLAVRGPDVDHDAASIADCPRCTPTGNYGVAPSTADRDAADRGAARDTAGRDADARADCRPDRAEREMLPSSGDCSLAVQCPACDSTDVGVAASDLLVCYGPTTTS
ncbi:hypothetical protein [Halorussus sp. MSC15.2]|uniref:hypothetical protein n=1 Tax=Halorussus sp. MSC15.2 TaxID=2283638 RepID=UPI0013D4EABF|nr:hypothetical protein [Halorussus sp. MSC15.2]NEU56116.1 hypothetical protein [Halorussus sp. MSC15.2]